METGTVVVIGPFDGRDLGERRYDGARAYRVHATAD